MKTNTVCLKVNCFEALFRSVAVMGSFFEVLSTFFSSKLHVFDLSCDGSDVTGLI